MCENILARTDAYAFFTDLFMCLPDERFARFVLDDSFVSSFANESDPAGDAFVLFQRESKGRQIGDVLEGLAIDRTQLLRGVREDGILPPYESLYVSAKSEESCLAVAEAYRAAGFGISASVKEPPEYIGCEMGFMLELCRRQAEACGTGDQVLGESFYRLQSSFFRDHPGRWAHSFANNVVAHAETDFFRGVGYLLSDFMAEEKSLLIDKEQVG